jgi:hypothetical protein
MALSGPDYFKPPRSSKERHHSTTISNLTALFAAIGRLETNWALAVGSRLSKVLRIGEGTHNFMEALSCQSFFVERTPIGRISVVANPNLSTKTFLIRYLLRACPP